MKHDSDINLVATPAEISDCLGYLLPDRVTIEDIREANTKFADGLLRLVAAEIIQQKKKDPTRNPALPAAGVLTDIFYKHVKWLF